MAIVQLDTENADRDLTSQVTVLTDTPDASNPIQCQAIVYLGDGTKDLDGSGGDFEMTITVGGQTVEPDPQTISASTATRIAIASEPFTVPANDEVVIKVKSPNAADTDVDVTAYLYDVFPLNNSSGIVESNVKQVSDDGTAADNLELITEISNITSLAVDASGHVEADVVEISGDSTAADNAESAFDGTGYDLGGIDVSELNGIVDDWIDAGRLDALVDAIKAKTDNLPASPAAVGSEMALEDDAITSAKYDETTAYPLASADTGSTEVARTGADGDTLEVLSDEIAALNDLSAAEVDAEVDEAIENYGLDHLVAAAVVGTDITDDSIIAQLVSKEATADWDDYLNTSDSLQALRDHIGDGTNLTEAGGDGDHLTEAGGTGNQYTEIPWRADWDAEVQSEVDDALKALHLDHLLAADYDPSAKPGVATALLNELVENDGGVSRFTANALEQGPDTTTGITLDAAYDAAKTAAQAGDEMNLADDAITSAKYDETTAYPLESADSGSTEVARTGADSDTLEDISDEIAALNDLSAADVNAEVDTAIETYHLDHLLAADYDPASKPGVATALLNELVESDGGVSRFTANALEAITDDDTQIDASALNTLSGHDPGSTLAAQTDVTGLNDPTSADIADAVWDEAQADHTSAGSTGESLDDASSGASAADIADAVLQESIDDHKGTANSLAEHIDEIQADTNELQSDDVPGLISALNDLSAADVDAEVDEAIENYGLDHLVNAAVTGTDITDDSIIAKLVSKEVTADWDDFDNTTEALQALRDHIGDGSNLTEAGGDGDHLTEAGGTGDQLTAIPWNAAWDAEVESEVDDALGAGGADLNSIPWNAAWDAEVQSECADALNAYDPPTNTEMDNAFAALNDLSAADVNAQVLDVLNVDTFAELASVPNAAATITQMIRWLYILARNKIEQTSGTQTLYADDGSTPVGTSSTGDDGTTATRSKYS